MLGLRGVLPWLLVALLAAGLEGLASLSAADPRRSRR